MTARSVMLGLALGLFIASATFFNDFVVRQTMLVASHLPIAVFGLVILVVLLVNPILRLIGRGTPLRLPEIAITIAIALAACGWPGSNFWRYAITNASMPIHWHRGAPSWQASGVMSYVPGGTGLLAPGQVVDAGALARALLADSTSGDQTIGGQLWAALPPEGRAAVTAAAAQERSRPAEQRALLNHLNAQLVRADLFDVEALPAEMRPQTPPPAADDPHEVSRWNHTLLARAYPQHVLPVPRGDHAIVGGGKVDQEVIDSLITGHHRGVLFAPDAVPWSAWWPTLGMWAGVALLLGLASLCVALIVHPQWAQRELLPYPIARLVAEVAARDEGAALPRIATASGFWIALLAIVAVHSLNGLHGWYPSVPTVPLQLDFSGFRTLFPDAARVPHSHGVFTPVLFFTVIGFAFFIPTAASLSMGLSTFVWVAFGGVMLTQGIAMDYSKSEPSRANFLRFGAYLAMAVIIFYTGRRYYLSVLRSALGAARAAETPRSAVWASRALPPLLAGAICLLYSAGMEVWIASLLIGVIMLAWLVLNRIICETGMIFVTNAFIAAVIVEGLVGFEALGPTGLLLVVMASWTLIGDPREAVMPYISNALAMIDRSAGGARMIGKVTPWLIVMLIVSMFVAGYATLTLQYENGVTSMGNDYGIRYVPSLPFDRVATLSADAAASGTLAEAVGAEGWDRLANVEPEPALWPWMLFGFMLVLATAVARLRLPSFPLHPVLFLVWGTYAAGYMSLSFLIGCLIKVVVTRIGGRRGYDATKPLMVGLIAGELLASLLWMLIGATYYFTKGLPPITYSIFPG